MPALLLSLLGWGKSIGSAIFAWLSRRSLSEILLMLACAALTFLLIRAEGESRHWSKQSARWETLYKADHAELQRISSSRNEQKVVTRDRIKVVTQRIEVAGKRAERVEQAPVPGGCKTKPEIMGADL